MSGLGLCLQPEVRDQKPEGSSRLLDGGPYSPPKGSPSASGESAAVHHAQTSLPAFGDGAGTGDHEPAVVRTVESLTVAESDASAPIQEKEARTVGGIPS